MALVTAGLMNKEVAHRIGISEMTVKIHRGHVMRKMGTKSLADLVLIAENLGVVTTNPKRATGKIHPLTTVCVGIACPAGHMEYMMAKCSCGEGGSKTRIALNRFTEEAECPDVQFLLAFPRTHRRDSAKV